MKEFILNFKASIRFFTSIIISREFSVVYCLLGTIAQISHSYFLIESVSSLDGFWRMLQALFISIFISSSLLYFVAIADDTDKSDEGIKEFKRVSNAVLLFTVIEIIINIYYYTRHLIIDTNENESRIFDYIFAILISFLIPITIKLYSSNIRAKSWIDDIEHDKSALTSEDLSIENNTIQENITEEKQIEIIKELIQEYQSTIINSDSDKEFIIEEKLNEKVSEKFVNIQLEIDEQISASFTKNQELFLKQFENKVKLITTQNLDKLKQ